jgi:hypothetical protein
VEPVWRISAPHLQTADGRFLAIDETPNGLRLSLSAKKTDSTDWAIEVIATTAPKRPQDGYHEYRKFLTGQSTQSFRLRLYDGPHEGWYLAADPLRDEPDAKSKQSETIREWQITPDPKRAVVFDYVDTKYFVDHK